MPLDYEKIGRRIKKIRKQKHLSQAFVCEQLNRDRSYLCYIETAKRYPTLDGIVEIANYFEVSVDVLLGDGLVHNEAEINNALVDIFRDCSEYEKKLILDVAKEIKRSHRAHIRLD